MRHFIQTSEHNLKVSIVRMHLIDAETDTENIKWLIQDDIASIRREEVKSRYKTLGS